MKKLIPALILVIMFCSPVSVKAQWVTIPSAFANYISSYVSAAAISGSQLDTTNATMLGVVNMTITDYSVTDITGIQYFKGLRNLVVHPYITSFPQLPANLYSFEADQPSAASFSAPLPANLYALKVYYDNNLTSLPTLPSTLGILILSYDAGITTIPALPAGLTWLSVNNCSSISSIPAIPATVYHLDLSYNPSMTLPGLPPSMSYLNLSQSSFGPLVGFQATLDTFICSYCANITSLPNVPSSMVFLDLDHCNINSTGTMPNGMLDLILEANPLASIPYLPDTIYETLILDSMPNLSSVAADSLYVGITVSANVCPQIAQANFGNLPDFMQNAHNLPGGNFINIYANSDNLTYIGQFNAYINNLDFSFNQLNDIGIQGTILPYYTPGCNTCISLQNADSINFANNQLTSIDQNFFNYQGAAATWLNFNNNNFGFVSYVPGQSQTLLMNNCQITGFDASIAVNTYTLDLGNNPSLYCLPFLNGVGTLYTTGTPANCVPDIPEYYFYSDQNLTVCQQGNSYGCPLSPEAGGIVFNDANQNGYQDNGETVAPGVYVQMQQGNFLHLSDSTGHYLFQCQPQVSYTITGMPTLPYRTVTTNPYNEFFTAFGADTFDNIGIYTQPNVNDIEVFLFSYQQQMRPGFHQDFWVTGWNVGTTTENGQITMDFNPTLSYQSSTPPGTVNGNSITWNVSNLPAGSQFGASVDFIIPVPVPLGAPISMGLHANCNTPDTTPLNNNDTLTGIATGSYDPNTKTVSPSGPLAIQQIANGGYLTYTVSFQNTGTASAINIVVLDTLDPNLDISTFQFITSSNKYTWTIDNGILTVTFNNINLPDSGQSQTASYAFFAYRIKALSTATPGQQIQNSASIYFDFNPPVATNTDTTAITTFFPTLPQSQVLCSGEPLLLTVGVNNAVTSLEWYKNGQPTGITSDTIYVASATAANNGDYTVRILAKDGNYYNSSTTGVSVVTDTTPLPTFNITNNGIITGCSNSLYYTSFNIVNLQNNTNPYQYFVWYLNDSLVQSSTQESFAWYHHYKNGDRLSCYPRTGGCQNPAMAHGDSAVFNITGTDTLNMTTTPTTLHICQGADITLHAQVNNPELHPNYFKWFINSQILSDPDSITLTAVAANTMVIVQIDTTEFVCSVLSSLNGRNLARDTIYITVDSTDQIPVGVLNTTYSPYLCPPGASRFTALGTNLGVSPTYIWIQNNIDVGTTVTPDYTTAGFQTGDVMQCDVLRTICGVTDTVYSNQIVPVPDNNFEPFTSITVQANGNCTTQATVKAVSENTVNIGGATAYNWYINGVYYTDSAYDYPTLNFARSSNGKADTVLLVMNTGVSCYPLDSSVVILPPVGSGQFTIIRYENDTVCAGSTVYFYPSITDTVIWYKNGIAVDTLPSNHYFEVLNDSVDFSLYALSKVEPCYGLQASDTIQQHYAHTLTNPVISMNVPASFCANNVPQFTATSNLSSATYYWYLNGSYYGYGQSITPNSGSIYTDAVLVLEVTPTAGCIPAPGTFYDTLIINSIAEKPTITLDTGLAILCGVNHGQTFSVQTTYAGSYPGYRWFLNGQVVGTNSPVYYDANLNTGDKIYCVLNSDNPCAELTAVNSDTLLIQGGNPVTPLVSISAQAPVCSGTPVSFTATGTNGGPAPVYQWQVNGVNVSGNSATFTTSALDSNDVVSCILTSSLACVTTPTVTSNADTVKVYPSPHAVVTAQGALTFCQGDSVTLSVGATSAYRWSNSATTQAITVKQSGNFTVTVTGANNCSAVSTQTVVTANALPVAAVNGPLTICPGLHATLTASGGTNYSWNNGLGSGASISVNPDTTTIYTVTVTNSNNCSALAQQTVTVNDSATASITGPVQTCVGAGITLTANGGNTYTWANGLGSNAAIQVTPVNTTTYTVTTYVGANCSATASQTVVVNQPAASQFNQAICSNASYSFNNRNLTQAGAYTDTLQTIAGCDSIVTLNLTVNSVTVPTIVRSNDTLKTQSFTSYQWLLNGNSIGSTQNIVITQNGNYSVVVTNANNCTDTSEVISVTALGLTDITNGFAARLYPNPNNGSFILAIDNDEIYDVEILDMLGRMVLSQTKVSRKQEFDLTEAASGIYIVSILQNQQQVQRIKFSVVK